MSVKLSFIIPVYNSEKYIAGCLESLFRQGLSEDDFEVICVNDGSTDGSENILNDFAIAHKNIIILNQKNQGQSVARNVGMKVARGEYIHFIDSDDYIASNTTCYLLEKAISYRLDMLYTVTLHTNREDEYEPAFFDKLDDIDIMQGSKFFQTISTPNGACEYFLRREFVLSNNIFFEANRFCEDGMFTLSCLCLAQRVGKYNCDFYRYVKREGSTTQNYSEEHQRRMIESFLYTIFYIEKLASSNEKDAKFAEALRRRRDSYTFFLQIRMIRSSINYHDNKKIVKQLKAKGCYPNRGLAPHYGVKMVSVSKLFQIEFLYMIFIAVSRNQYARDIFEKINTSMKIRGNF